MHILGLASVLRLAGLHLGNLCAAVRPSRGSASSGLGEAVAGRAGLDDLAVEGEPVDDGAQSLGSVKVLVQPENGSLEATAMADFSSRSVSTPSCPRRSDSWSTAPVSAQKRRHLRGCTTCDTFAVQTLLGWYRSAYRPGNLRDVS